MVSALIVQRSNLLRSQRKAFWEYICVYSERTAHNQDNPYNNWQTYLNYVTYLLFIHEALKTETLEELLDPSTLIYWKTQIKEYTK